MEQDAPIPKVTLRTHSSRGHARSDRASHGASTSINSTTQEMDPMTSMLQRLDSQDVQLHKLQGQLTYIIYWIHTQSDLSSFLPPPPPSAQLFHFSLYVFLFIYMFIHCLSYVSKIILLIYTYLCVFHSSIYLLCAFSCLYFCYFPSFVTKG